jgi:hypothetical protein
MTIDTGEARPIKHSPIRYPPQKRELVLMGRFCVGQEVEQLLDRLTT